MERSRLDHHDGMSRRDPEYFADQMPKLPHEQITTGIRLNRDPSSFNFNRMITELSEKNMDRCKPTSEDPIGVEVFSGYPPSVDFGRHHVLQIVRKYAPHAELVLVPARG